MDFRNIRLLGNVLLIIGLCLICPVKSAYADSYNTILLSDNSKFYSIAADLAYFEDASDRLTINEITSKEIQSRFVNDGGAARNFGTTISSYWFRIMLKNTEGSPATWWLEVKDPLLDRVGVFYINEKDELKSRMYGDHYPLDSRDIKTRNPVMSLDFLPNETLDVYINIKTYGVVHAPIFLWKPQAYPKQASDLQIRYGIYYGIIAALLIYNMMIFFSVRDPSYFYYCLFITVYAFCRFCYNGFSYQYLWPNNGHYNLVAVFIASQLYVVCMLQFTRHFMRIPKLFPRLNKFMIFAISMVFVPMIIFFFFNKGTGVRANAFYLGSTILLVLSVGIFALYKNIEEARYFMLAWVALLVGMFMFQLMMFGILPAKSFVLYGQQIGSAMEAILLSFALAHRMRLLTEENERMQKESNENLEKHVNERTNELNEAMQKLSAANQLLKENNFNDGLTGVRNRLYFDEHCSKEWLRCRREISPITLLMVDIDHFKSINDNHGHLCGDYALRFIADILQDNVRRPGDVVARYGGEEFVVIMPNTTSAGGSVIAENIRLALENKAFEFHDDLIKLTVSIGCATDYPAKTDRSPNNLIDAADSAMYSAKREGRNQVKIA